MAPLPQSGRDGPQADPQPALPWWRHRIMWVVVGGPLIVVVAATATAVIAIRGADPVLDEDSRRAGAASGANAPAVKARNHAATPPGR